ENDGYFTPSYTFDAVLLKTTDGGRNWEEVVTPLGDPGDQDVRSMFFIDEMNGWLNGRGETEEGEDYFLVRTEDGGMTWTPVFTPVGMDEASDMYFDGNGFGCVAYPGRVLVTHDNGETWRFPG